MAADQSDSDFLSAISLSVERVLGKKPPVLHADMNFKSDLGLSSLDVVDVGYELEQITGLKVRMREVFLAQELNNPHKAQDVLIKDIIQYLKNISAKS